MPEMQMVVTQAATERIRKITEYILEMQRERVGWGDEAMADVLTTALSFAKAWNMLAGAKEVWADGQGYSLGGVMYGGIYFGVIATVSEPKPYQYAMGDERTGFEDRFKTFEHGPITWSFHS